MLMPWIPGASFLDLFSGSGGIAIEALSRGAKEAVLVEQGRAAAACIRQNLAFTHLEDQAFLMKEDVFSALVKLEGRYVFDCIFMDPPYDHELEKRVLEYLSSSSLLAEDGIVVVEASKKTDLSYIGSLGFSLRREKLYKTNKHVFLEKQN